MDERARELQKRLARQRINVEAEVDAMPKGLLLTGYSGDEPLRLPVEGFVATARADAELGRFWRRSRSQPNSSTTTQPSSARPTSAIGTGFRRRRRSLRRVDAMEALGAGRGLESFCDRIHLDRTIGALRTVCYLETSSTKPYSIPVIALSPRRNRRFMPSIRLRLNNRKGQQMTHWLLRFALGLVIVLTAVSPAMAGESQASRARTLMDRVAAADSPDLVVAALDNQDRALLIKALTLTKVVVTTSDPSGSASIQPFSSGCWSWTLGYIGQDAFGIELWRYSQKIDWCGDGSVVTSKTRTRIPTVSAPYWQFMGHIDNSEAGGVGSSYYYAYTQGWFHFELLGYIQNKYPWVYQYVYGDSGHSGNAGV